MVAWAAANKKTAGASGLDSVIELVPRREEKVARQKKKKSSSGSSKNLLFGTKIGDLEWSRLHPGIFPSRAVSLPRLHGERERDFHLPPPEKKEGGSNTLYPA